MLIKNFRTVILLLLVMLIISVIVSIHIGTIDITPSQSFAALLPGNPVQDKTVDAVIWKIRIPRIVAAIVAGAALAVSGASFQSMFINPLVSPGLLGVLAGSAFGSALGLLFGHSMLAAQIGAFVFGIAAVTFSMLLASSFKGNRLIMLLIGGIVSSSVFTSLISVLKFVADSKEELPGIVYWLMGGFSAVSTDTVKVAAPVIILGLVIIQFMSGYLNLLSMGDDEAKALGVRVTFVRNFLIVVSTLICCMTVALGGMISWVGLMIPHTARMLIGPDNRRLIPVSALLGAIYLLIIDDICRAAFTNEIPIGIMTSLIGVPFFILILWKTDRRWN
ncbi:MAG: iron ABC transporter permease [Candidatus Rifleibacteriota bacterium]